MSVIPFDNAAMIAKRLAEIRKRKAEAMSEKRQLDTLFQEHGSGVGERNPAPLQQVGRPRRPRKTADRGSEH